MNRTFPIEFLLGIEIAKILQDLPSSVGSGTKYLKTVTQGFTSPAERPLASFPLACVGAPNGGTFNSDDKNRITESITSNLQVFVYLYEPNPALATLKIERFVQVFLDKITDRTHNWEGNIPDISTVSTWRDGIPPDATPAVRWYGDDYGGIEIAPASWGYGDVFKTLGIDGKDFELLPPKYGIHFNLTATIGSAFM